MLKTFQSIDQTAITKAEALVAEAVATKFDYDKKVEFPDPVLSFWSEGKKMPVACRGMLVGLIGMQKSGKTFVLSAMMESFLLGGKERLNFELSLSGKVIYFDNEQSSYFYNATQKRIHDNSKIRGNTEKYSAFHLRKYSPAERVLIIEEIIYTTPDLHCIVLDGLAETLGDFNSVEQSTEAIQRVMRWCFDLNILTFAVLHTNKTTGTSRGHTGAMLEQKGDAVLKTEQLKRNEYTLSNPIGRFITFEDMTFNRNPDTGMTEYLPGSTKHNFV